METSYQEIPILHAFEGVLKDAFVESGASNFADWSDGKSLTELVGDTLAREFYTRWYHTEGISSEWARDIPFYLGGQINTDWQAPAVFVREHGHSDIRFTKSLEPNQGEWISRNAVTAS